MEKVGAYTDRVTPTGEWRPGNPATNVRATPMLADYFNMLQAEFLAILSDAGIAPDKQDDGQLAAAINAVANRNAVGDIDGVAARTVT